MKFYVGVTDNKWFEFLANRKPDEVNFWRLGELAPFRQFLLGHHFFSSYIVRIISLLVEVSLSNTQICHCLWLGKHLVKRMAPFPSKSCGWLFKDSDRLIDRMNMTQSSVVPSWQIPSLKRRLDSRTSERARSIVQGKNYETEDPPGAQLWAEVRERLVKGQLEKSFTELDGG